MNNTGKESIRQNTAMVQKVELLPHYGLKIRDELVVQLFENMVMNFGVLDSFSVKLYCYLLQSMVNLNKFTFNHTDRHLSEVLKIHRNVVKRSKEQLRDNGFITYVTETHHTVYSIQIFGTPHVPTSENIGTRHVPTLNIGTPHVPTLETDETNIGTRHVPTSPMGKLLEVIKNDIGTRHVPTSKNVGTQDGNNYSSSSIIYTSTKRENLNTEVENSKSQNGAVTTIEYLKSDEFLKILIETIPKENEARALIHSFYTKNRNRTYSEPSKIIEHFWNWLDKIQANEKQYQIIVQGYQNKTKSEAGIKWENVKVGLLKSEISNDVVKLLKLKKFENNELVIETLNPVVEYLESETVINIFKQLIRSNYGKCKVSYSIRKSQ